MRRDTDDERQLDGVDVAEAGGVALVEQGGAKWLVGVLVHPGDDEVEVGELGSAQVGTEVADDA